MSLHRARYEVIGSLEPNAKNVRLQEKATHVHGVLEEKARQWGVKLMEEEFAEKMDEEDPLSDFRDMFHYPKCGNLPMSKCPLSPIINGYF